MRSRDFDCDRAGKRLAENSEVFSRQLFFDEPTKFGVAHFSLNRIGDQRHLATPRKLLSEIAKQLSRAVHSGQNNDPGFGCHSVERSTGRSSDRLAMRRCHPHALIRPLWMAIRNYSV
ncbi:MAG: hypothetical protein PVI23_16500 [Maricaulaceae bacterium]